MKLGIELGTWLWLQDGAVGRAMAAVTYEIATLQSAMVENPLVAVAIGLLAALVGKLSLANRRLQREALQEGSRVGEADFYRAIISDAPFPLLVCAEDGEVLEFNDAWTELMGYIRPNAPTMRHWAERAHSSGRVPHALEAAVAEKCFPESCWEEGDFAIRTRSGQQQIWQFSSAPLTPLPDGRRTALSMAVDVTQRRQAERALRESEARYRGIYEQLAVGLASLSQDGRLLDVNRRFCQLLGYTREELLARSFAEITYPEDRGQTDSKMARLFCGEIARFFQERRYLCKDNTVLWSSTEISLVRDEGCQPQHALAAVRETGDRVKAERRLRHSEERLRLALRAANQALYDLDLESDRAIVSPEYFRMLGYEDTEECQETVTAWRDRVHPDDRGIATRAYQAYEAGEVSQYHAEFRLRGRSGWKWILSLGQFVAWDAAGRPKRMVGTHTDISDRKRAEAAIQNLIAGTATATGRDFFPVLVKYIAEALQTPYAAVAYVAGDNELRTLACWTDGKLQPTPSTIAFAGTPCEMTLSRGTFYCECSVRQVFPQDRNLAASDVESYLGVALRDSQKKSIGTLCVLGLQALPEPRQAEEILRVFAARAAAELERQHAQEALQASEERYRLLAENTSDLVCLHEPDGRYLFVSPSCETLLGYHHKEMVGRSPDEFCHPDDRERVRQRRHAWEQPGPVTYRLRQKSGHYCWFETLTRAIQTPQGETIRLQTTSRDVTDRVKAQEQLVYEARHDRLTDLPNRTLLVERLEYCLQQQRREPQRQFALLFLDLDRFKVVNDSLGHAVGDRILVVVARRLQNATRNAGLAARLGGDEFVVLLTSIESSEDALRAAAQLSQALQAPIDLGVREVTIGASIGIVLSHERYKRTGDLLRDADLAMYRAKARSGPPAQKIAVFNPEMHARALQRLHLESDLRQALQRGEFCLHYQPIVDLSNDRPVGVESLVRWQHPGRGLIAPGEFIAVAEETGAIALLDRWVLQTASQALARWRQHYPQSAATLKVGVNLCARDLQAEDFVAEIDRALAAGIPGSCLTLEITESMLVENMDETLRLFDRLKERRIQLSIDDFGTGYSSLSYLHRWPADSLKIDRSFVSQMQNDRRSREIIETIIALSNRLGVEAIAEGIETRQQRDALARMGCELGQGYYFARPLSAPDIEAFLFGSSSPR